MSKRQLYAILIIVWVVVATIFASRFYEQGILQQLKLAKRSPTIFKKAEEGTAGSTRRDRSADGVWRAEVGGANDSAISVYKNEKKFFAVTPPEASYVFPGDLHFSPDGTKLAYTVLGRDKNGTGAVIVLDIITKKQTVLETLVRGSFRIAGWYDNARVAYTANARD